MREALRQRCNDIEEAYEYMLAYAAQGLSGDRDSQAGGELRTRLTRLASALDGLSGVFADLIARDGLQPADRYRDFGIVLERDAAAASAAAHLVLAQPAISSQLVDNLNASIHLRALLTDLFLLDELLGTQA
ncbi:MAG: hypothetical protein AB7I50_08760 [Vicinamibacterales bacterium]